MLEQYLSSNNIKKLHVGCGPNKLSGWLNSDALHHEPGPTYILDVSRQFPIADNTFDYVYSEHMIEHIEYNVGQYMINESYRILKPGGKIRITTPDINFLIDIYKNPENELYQRYLNWSTPLLMPWAPSTNPIFLFNNFVRAWGHVFIYDKNSLAECLMSAGFHTVTEHKICESADVELQDLENYARMGKDFLQLESMTLEAIK
jgi:predicted SAM-dependent methyltransferase